MDDKIINLEEVKRRENGVGELIDDIIEEDPDEVVAIVFKGGSYRIIHSAIDSVSKIVGALEIAKFKLIENSEII